MALEKKEHEAEQKHAELLTTQHANEKARLEAQVEREMATMRLVHVKAEQEFAARRAYYQVGFIMLVSVQCCTQVQVQHLHGQAGGCSNRPNQRIVAVSNAVSGSAVRSSCFLAWKRTRCRQEQKGDC